MIGFPLYNPVSDVNVGVEADSFIETAQKYEVDKPVVFLRFF